MPLSFFLTLAIVFFAYVGGWLLAGFRARQQQRALSSHARYFGWFCALCAVMSAGILLLGVWILPVAPLVLDYGLPLAAFSGAFAAALLVSPVFPAQRNVERLIVLLLKASAVVALVTTIFIILSLAFETGRFFSFDDVDTLQFFIGTDWSAQTASAFGAVPLFFGTFFVAFLAIAFAGPIGLYSAVYLSEYASDRTRRIARPMLEVLAGIPTVVYGFFAVLFVGPLIQDLGNLINTIARPLTGEDDLIRSQPRSALAAGLVMAIMILPLISSLSHDVLRTVPAKLRNGALGLGATQAEMMKHIVLPAALPGLMAVFLLAISRAIGETMIVAMALGERANITLNPFDDMTTVTVQIVSLLTGDPEFDGPRSLSAFALGAVLFVLTLGCNMVAQLIVDKQRLRHGKL